MSTKDRRRKRPTPRAPQPDATPPAPDIVTPPLPGGCFAAGTLITLAPDAEARTPREAAVETLRPGDELLVPDTAGPAIQALAAIASRTIDPVTHPAQPLVTPIRIRAGAIGPDMPRRDLLLPAEALLRIQNESGFHFVPAGALVNGVNVTRQPRATAWHSLSLPAHSVVLAENLAVATLQGAAPLHTPLHPPGPALAALRSAILARADDSPPPEPPAESADSTALLRLFASGAEIAAEPGSTAERFDFLLPAATGPVRLVSPTGESPSETDARRLGVCVLGVEVDGQAVDLDGPIPGPGFYPSESNEQQHWRWTSGSAWLVLPPATAPRRLSVIITDWHRHLLFPTQA